MEHKSICKHLFQGPLEGRASKCTCICRLSSKTEFIEMLPTCFQEPVMWESTYLETGEKPAYSVLDLQIFVAGSVALKFFMKFSDRKGDLVCSGERT